MIERRERYKENGNLVGRKTRRLSHFHVATLNFEEWQRGTKVINEVPLTTRVVTASKKNMLVLVTEAFDVERGDYNDESETIFDMVKYKNLVKALS